MAQHHQSDLVTFFADISGSTSLYEKLGDVEAKEQVAQCIGLIMDRVHSHQGTMIKTIGDEVMCTFPDPETAANAAISMQDGLSGNGGDQATRYIRAGLAVRIGFHYGPVLHEDGDVFGDSVNLAARVAGQAKAAQIITTQSTVDMLPPPMKASTRFVDHALVKGKREEVSIFEIIWQQDNLTRMATSFVSSLPKVTTKLVLRHGDTEVVMDPEEQPSATLGRLQECQIIVDSDRASRQHARIEFRRGQYFLIDQSTNGTYVKSDDEDEAVFLRREEMPLKTSGSFALGVQVEQAGAELIYYLCKD